MIRTGTSEHGKWHLTQVLASPDLGGGERVALDLCRYATTRLNHNDISAFVPGNKTTWSEASTIGCGVSRFHRGILFSRSKLLGYAYGHVLAKRMSLRPGVVHFHSPFEYGALSRHLPRVGLRTVLHLHLDYEIDALKWALKRPPETIITCASFLEGLARRALPRSATEVNIVTIRNAVNTEVFSPGDRVSAKRRIGFMLDSPLVVMIANLSPHKGQEVAMRAVASVRARGLDAKLWIIGAERGGATEYTTYLRQTIKSLKLEEAVSLEGFRRDVPDILRAADVMLLPSKSEGLPLSILEAQACRTLVVAAPTAGIPEVVHDGLTGYLIGPDDWNGFADVIVRVTSDRQLYASIVNAAYDRVTKVHTANAYHQSVWSVYEQMLGK